MNVSSFLSETSKFNGFANSSKFKVSFIKLPDNVIENLFDGDAKRRLTLMCEQAELPGKNMKTFDKRIYGYKFELPITTEFLPVTFTFLAANDMKERMIFEKWQTFIQDRNTYDMEYPYRYYGTVRIVQMDEAGNAKYSVMLRDAYPRDVQSMPLNWGGNEFHRVTVTMTYKSYNVEELESDGIEEVTITSTSRPFIR